MVLAGYSYNNGFYDYSIVRLNINGSLDTSFGDDGKLILPVGTTYDGAYSVIQQADGKLVLVGFSNSGCSIVRLNSDGSLDTNFSDGGKLILPVGTNGGEVYEVIQQTDGKLVLAGYSSNDGNLNYSIMRLNANGSLDTSFSDDGKLVLPVVVGRNYAHSVIQQSDGKLVLAGPSDGGYSIIRLNADGSVDTSFQVSSPNRIIEANGSNVTSTAIVLTPHAKVSDYELATAGNYAGASLTIARNGGANSSDVFANTGTLGVLTQGSYFSVDSVTIGRVTTNSNGTLTLTFNSNATQALVDKALQQITFATRLPDAPPPSIKLDWTFNDGNTGSQGDGGAKSVTTSLIVSITATNDAPLSHNLIPNTSVTANQAFNLALPTGAFTDPDVVDTLTYSLTMTNGTAVPPWLSINSSTGAISGTPESFDIGSLSLRVTATDSSGAKVSDDFSLTTLLTNPSPPTGSVTIAGAATQGQTLTASNSLADADGMGTVSYQWKANGSNITGATNSTYTLTQAEVGKTISVVASYTDGSNTVESVTSTVTAAVVGLYTPVTPLAAVKYFVTGSANNFVEFDMDYGSAGLSLAGSQILYTGGSGVESVYVAKTVSIDFTKASGNTDKIYLNASANDYNYSYQGTTLVLTDKHTNAVVKLAAGSSLSNDRIIFKDGSVKSNNLMDALKANTQPSLDTSLFTPNSKAALYTDLGTQAINTIKAFATNAEGATFATTPKAGTNMIVTGGAGVDKVYVSPYASVDATKLSGGTDLVYFTGKLSDYSKSISGTTLQLSRSNGSETESVKVAAGSSLAYDKLVFADGFVKSIDLFNASKNNTAQPTLDTSLFTPGLEVQSASSPLLTLPETLMLTLEETPLSFGDILIAPSPAVTTNTFTDTTSTPSNHSSNELIQLQEWQQQYVAANSVFLGV